MIKKQIKYSGKEGRKRQHVKERNIARKRITRKHQGEVGACAYIYINVYYFVVKSEKEKKKKECRETSYRK